MLSIRGQKTFFHGAVGTGWQVLFVPPNDGVTYVLQDLHVPLGSGSLQVAEVSLVTGASAGDAYGSSPAVVDFVVVIGGQDTITKMNYKVPYGRMLVGKASAVPTTTYLQGVLAK